MTASERTEGPAAATSLADIARLVSLDAAARSLFDQCATPGEFLDLLAATDSVGDAVRALSLLLPARRAVWWATLSAWEATGGKPNPAENETLGAAVHWVIDPSEAMLQSIHRTLGRLERRTAVHELAMAVAFAGFCRGPGQPLLTHDPLRTARSTCSAVLQSFTAAANRGHRVALRQLLDVGLDIRDGKLPWHVAQERTKRSKEN